MRQLTADTMIRIKPERPVLTGDTKIRLSQIKDLATWVEDKHSKYRPGDTAQWKDGLHQKTDARKQKIPAGATKPLLLKRNIINRNTGKHKEFKGEDKKILHLALEKGNVIRHNKPNEKPNYYVIAKSGSYYYMATIDIDPQKKYNEVVDWRKVNEKKFK